MISFTFNSGKSAWSKTESDPKSKSMNNDLGKRATGLQNTNNKSEGTNTTTEPKDALSGKSDIPIISHAPINQSTFILRIFKTNICMTNLSN